MIFLLWAAEVKCNISNSNFYVLGIEEYKTFSNMELDRHVEENLAITIHSYTNCLLSQAV